MVLQGNPVVVPVFRDRDKELKRRIPVSADLSGMVIVHGEDGMDSAVNEVDSLLIGRSSDSGIQESTLNTFLSVKKHEAECVNGSFTDKSGSRLR